MTNIILCGGSGTRLWPISRTLMPKQFVKLFLEESAEHKDDKSLFQLTVERNSKVCDNQFIVSNEEQYFLALDQLEELGKENNRYLLEPIGRNTAPAIALACMALDKDEVVLVTPSDHLIKNEKEYQNVLQKAKELAQQNNLVTFGITPSFPETGFGYIETNGEWRMENGELNGLDVVKFHEKPDIDTAKKYLAVNSKPSNLNPKTYYFWNSGMFCFKAGVFLDELKKYTPKIYETCKIAFDNKKTQNSILRIQHSHMEAIPTESIDYAVMEKSNIVKVVPSDIGWSDVGSFDSLCEELKIDNGELIIEENSKDNFYFTDDKSKVIATIGLEDYIVVDTKDALLISKKGETQKVKKIVEKLNMQNSKLTIEHSTVHRPWGTYTVLEDTSGYKIKKILVKPGKRLSLQKHFHRNEHWIVVSGTATVIVGDKKMYIRPNESTYIKMGEIHRLENEGKIPVVMIEVQVGEYTGEDDIIRIEDDFERK